MTKESLKRIRKLFGMLGGDFVGRGDAVKLLLACTMAGIPIVLFGPPGTAKTLMVRRMAEYCGLSPGDGSYFDYLLTQHTMPEEVFGPPNTGNGAGDKTFGFPRFRNASFHVRFPFGTVKLSDPTLPLDVEVTGWSPFEPGDADRT